jgi:hypothetical protein
MKRTAINLLVFAGLLFTTNTLTAQVPYGRNSFPSASATIFLDFDGQTVNCPYWNNGIPFICAPSGLTNAGMIRVFNQVAEDFRPFNLNITTDSAVYFAAPATSRQRIIITPTNAWWGSNGGVAIQESFRFGYEWPAFSFTSVANYDPKFTAELTSHELGHTLGLNHQSRYNSSCGMIYEYEPGTGTGEISWAPLMGSTTQRNLTLWHNGKSSEGCSTFQDDLQVLASSANGFGYRTDDVGNTSALAAPVSFTNNSYAISGIINNTSDVDFYNINLSKSGRLVVNALPFSVATGNVSANIDLQIALMNGSTVIGSYNPGTTVQAIIDTTVNAGNYYLRVNNTSNVNASNYGMLGNYNITGSFTASGSLPIHSMNLSGSVDQGQHRLNWNIVADEAIESIRLEVSAEGRNFTKLEDLTGTTRQFAYKPMDSKPLYYRLFVTTASQLTYYSNIVSLKETATSANYTLLSNRINGSDIVVNSKGSYSWRLLDMNGRSLQNGRLTNGVNRLQTPVLNSGMYLLQVVDGTNITTERLIKN